MQLFFSSCETPLPGAVSLLANGKRSPWRLAQRSRYFSLGINQPWQSAFINSARADPTADGDTCEVLSCYSQKKNLPAPRDKSVHSLPSYFILTAAGFLLSARRVEFSLSFFCACPSALCIHIYMSFSLSRPLSLSSGLSWAQNGERIRR